MSYANLSSVVMWHEWGTQITGLQMKFSVLISIERRHLAQDIQVYIVFQAIMFRCCPRSCPRLHSRMECGGGGGDIEPL
ncbi:hypothetical protein NPIL_624131 [Nephila pilipes]|uniref:Uncharacterized protein n=1 Tax=Nephila pilipes TaxID=299642 RepID=A0A8X6NEF1_NEPPI|nr:hypothetical protein NPIL_624131 [Nephila pilipes]